jgi:type I restriction enzyme S subunit
MFDWLSSSDRMTLPPIDISPADWRIVRDILRKHVPKQQVWAFGSRAKRAAWTYSDLDLAIMTETPLPFKVRGDMAEDFSESDLPFRVDILDWATTLEDFRRVVERDKVVVQRGIATALSPDVAQNAALRDEPEPGSASEPNIRTDRR